MPINHPGKRFARTDIESLNLNQTGVYVIYNSQEWIYVGRGDIRERLLAHLNGDIPCILKNSPTGWKAEVTGDSARREKELIVELQPKCNQKVG